MGFLRPGMGSRLRRWWNPLHWTSGRITLLLAWSNLFIGIYLFHASIYATAYAPWLGPTVAAIGALLATHAVLDVLGCLKRKRDGVDPLKGAATTMEGGAPSHSSNKRAGTSTSSINQHFDDADGFTQVNLSPRAGARAGAGAGEQRARSQQGGVQLGALGGRAASHQTRYSDQAAVGSRVLGGQRTAAEHRAASPVQDGELDWARYGPGGGDGRAI